GRMEIDQLNELFDLNLPQDDDYTTIAGYILHHVQRFPNIHETIEIDNYIFKIIKVTERKIEIIELIINENNL
ncbi:MAG: hemolysin, partial [Bacteroidales bacterium]|nr:hemolysin [Bacteroidales bacterium]